MLNNLFVFDKYKNNIVVLGNTGFGQVKKDCCLDCLFNLNKTPL